MKHLWIAAAALAALIVVLRHPSPAASAVAVSTAAPRPYVRHAARPLLAQAVVYVAGAVVRPGLYRLPAGARANDAVVLAGGFAAKADQAGVNLAQRVEDGDEIRVPLVGERTVRAATRSRAARSTRARKQNPQPLDLNAASPDELAALPGVGPALAQRIVAFRETNGTFASADELLDVAGMTQRRLDAIAPYLLVNGGR